VCSEYEKIWLFENLWQAHKVSRRGRRKKGEVIRYEVILSEKLISLQARLKANKLEKLNYYHFTITDPKRREVFATNYDMRVMLHSLTDNVVAPTLKPKLIYDNCACQKGKGVHFAIKRVDKFLHSCFNNRQSNQFYVLKCDIYKYFDSINHEILLEKLSRVFLDKDVFKLLEKIVNSYESMPNTGLPLGNQTSQWFAIYYLDGFDRFIKERKSMSYYVRYMDDFIVISEDKRKLQQLISEMKQFLQGLQLRLNASTRIYKAACGFPFLGLSIRVTKKGKVIHRMRTASKVRMRKRLKVVEAAYKNGELSIEQMLSSFMSYLGHLKYVDDYHLNLEVKQHLQKLGFF
jgi:retron-type reverse transcriptase